VKKLNLVLLTLVSVSILFSYLSAAETVDKMLAIIYHPEGDIPIIKSELNSGFEGKKSLEAVVFDKHVELDGKVLKVEISEEDVNRHLAHVQKIYNLTKDDTIKYAKGMGLTYEQFIEELAKGLLRERVLGYRMKGGSSYDKDEALAYHNDNPVQIEAVYTIKHSFIPYGSNSPSLMKLRVEDAVANGTIDTIAKWLSPVELKESQIAEDKAFIKSLELGKSAVSNVTDKGIALIQLFAKEPSKMLTFDERETEIKNFLARSKQERSFSEYKDKLYATSSIKYIE